MKRLVSCSVPTKVNDMLPTWICFLRFPTGALMACRSCVETYDVDQCLFGPQVESAKRSAIVFVSDSVGNGSYFTYPLRVLEQVNKS